ncbi:MAG: hypothetical protein HY331_05040 [Chloroflexi bacterium]|nr:hypothetical protein [Chloroflexota bacterium]
MDGSVGESLARQAPPIDRRLADMAGAGLRAVTTDAGIVASSAAGVFHHLCGRDALIAVLQLLGLARRLIANPPLQSLVGVQLDDLLDLGERTLRTLAATQGRQVNPWNEEEPGKIIHEWVPHRPQHFTGRYYASNDATALFLIAAAQWRDAAERVDPARAADVWQALSDARSRALGWYFQYGDLDGDGLVEFVQRHPERASLRNQNWKDSWDSLLDEQGRPPAYPVRYAEVQAYWYRAFRAEAVRRSEPDRSRLLAQAAAIKNAFNRAFWLPALETFAPALDAGGKPLSDIVSNTGHCLWAGICDADLAGPAAARLLAPDLLTPFGLRTLSSASPHFQPLRYHRGTIWPVDNWFAREGLLALGWDAAARQVDAAMARAIRSFNAPLELLVLHDGAERPEWYRSRPDAPAGENRVQAWTVGYCFLLALDAQREAVEPATVATVHERGGIG